MKTSTDLRSNFKVFVNQELHRNKIHCWMKFTVYKIHPLGCLDAFGKEELAAARRNSVPGEADKELIPIFIFLFHFFSSLLQRCRSGLNYLLHFPCTSQTSGSPAGLRDYLDIKPEYQIFCVLAKNSVCEQKAGGTCSRGFICVPLLFRNLLEFQRSSFFLTSTYSSINLDIHNCRAARLIHFFIWFWGILLLASFLKEEKRGGKRRILEFQTTILSLFLFR